jgi:hypothetical protein
MSKRIVAITTLTTVGVFLAGSTWANPIGSIGELARQGQVARDGAAGADCDAIRRSSDLRARLRPSERRELIRRCEMANRVVYIAENQTIREPGL